MVLYLQIMKRQLYKTQVYLILKRKEYLRNEVHKAMAYFNKQVTLLGEQEPHRLDYSIDKLSLAIKRSERWNARIVNMDFLAKIALEDGNTVGLT